MQQALRIEGAVQLLSRLYDTQTLLVDAAAVDMAQGVLLVLAARPPGPTWLALFSWGPQRPAVMQGVGGVTMRHACPVAKGSHP